MNAIPMLETARDVARGLSLFEISDSIKSAFATYAEAFGYKVDRIADFLKAQRAEPEIAQREAERFQNRHRAAENREKRLKQLLVWFMLSRHVPKLRGEFNTISLQANSTPCLVIQDASHIPASFYRARIDLTWPGWIEILESLPAGILRERLAAVEGKFIEKELQRGILSDALARGEPIPGASLVKGHHIRLR